jgi:HEPN domain-containing protein
LARYRELIQYITIESLGFNIEQSLYRCARKLDKFYIPTRYPDAIGLGSPFESFDEDDFKIARDCTARIIDFVSSALRDVKDN